MTDVRTADSPGLAPEHGEEAPSSIPLDALSVARAPLRTAVTSVLIILGIALPFMGSSTQLTFATTVWITAIVVLGMNFMIANTGLVSLGQAAIAAAGAYGTTLLMVHAGFAFWAGLLGAAVAAGLVGLVLAFPSVRVKGPYFAIITILLGSAIPQLINVGSGFTGGYNGIYVSSPSFGVLTSTASVYYLAFGLMVVVMAFVANLQRSQFGRSLRMIKTHPVAASTYGIRVVSLQIAGVTIGNVLAGLGGGLLALDIGGISPADFTLTQSIYYLIGAVVGGTHSVFGALIGAALVDGVLQVLSGASYYATIVLGAILVVALLVLPNGLIAVGGYARNVVMALAGRRRREQNEA